jgi:protein TonB
VAPKELVKEKPPEASDAQKVDAIAMAVGGQGKGDGTGSPDGVPGGTGTEAGPVSKPINLPENATPSEPLDSNVAPEFPPEARSSGLEGLVIFKVVIDEEGRITAVKLMKGDEPFVSAAMKVIRSWRYSPAMLDGQPVKHFKVVKIPFRIRS